MLEPLKSKQTLDEAFKVRDLEEGVNSRYCVLNVGRTRRIGSFADDFVVFPVGKSSVSYTCVMLSVQ